MWLGPLELTKLVAGDNASQTGTTLSDWDYINRISSRRERHVLNGATLWDERERFG
jgi:hypothetical protein